MKQKKKIAGKLLRFVLTLAMVTGLFPGMNMTVYASTDTVGNTDNTSGYGTVVTQELTLTNDMVAKFSFTNYTDQVNYWDNWSTFVSSTSGSFTAGYRFRADAWEDEKNTNTNVTNNYDWDTFKEEMDGADVEITVAFLDGWATTHVAVTARSGKTYFEEYSEHFKNAAVYTWLTVNYSHMENVMIR